ncbi:MAG: outer membrane lipoprotein LolB [Dechloromonas sp.]|nr:outer membrane lipoprotein LolB [Dechloromonas sp.]
MRAIFAALLLAGCASLPPSSADRDSVGDFALDARFALRSERPGEPPAHASGRLSWTHEAGRDSILLSSPFGQGLAEITVDADGARLRSGDGRLRQASDPATLVREATGYTLPLGELPAWLLGRAHSPGALSRDAQGRPARLREDGWTVDYAYDDPRPGALPAGLTITRESELELRLRIEDWKTP